MSKADNNVFQSDFTGGMVDSSTVKAVSSNSYRYAENLDFSGNELTFRPGTLVQSGPGGIRGTFYYSSSLGDFWVIVNGSASGFVAVFLAQLDSSGGLTSYFQLKFPALFGYSDLFYGDASNPIGYPVVFLQVGKAAYVWIKRGAFVYVFRWNGVLTDGVGYFTQVATTFGSNGGVGEWVPPGLAAVYAYGRVFCACADGVGNVYNSLAVSSVVTDGSNPSLAFESSARLDLSGDSSDDILGMCPVGNGRVVVFKRNSVLMVKNCDGALTDMSVEIFDPIHGCVSPSAFVQVKDDVWFMSDGGVRSVNSTGASGHFSSQVPVTSPIERFWNNRVSWPVGVTYSASAAVFNSRLLFSIPLDGCSVNAILVYSLTHQCWVGVWTGLVSTNLFVSHISGGGGLKMASSDGYFCQLLSSSGDVDGYSARFVSRAFDGDAPHRSKQFVRAVIGLVSNSFSESTPINVVADFRSVDDETGVSVTHLSAQSMFGSIRKAFALGRVCRSLCLDVLFTSGITRLQSLSLVSIIRGRL